VFIKYGGSARHCYKLAKTPFELASWEQSIPTSLSNIPNPATFSSNLAGNNLDHNSERVIKAASQLITLFPDKNRQPQVTLVSKHIASHLYAVIAAQRAEGFWEYFNQFWSVGRSRPAAGWLWECHVLRHELSSEETRHLPLQRLPLIQSQSSPLDIELPFSSVVEFGAMEALATQLVEVIPTLFSRDSTKQKILFRPAIPTQATLDAFSISHGGLVQLYQVTCARKHPLRASGFDFLWDAMNLARDVLDSQYKSEIERLLFPSQLRPWQVIFAIPRRIQRIWEKPQRIDFGGLRPKRQWRSYIEQFRMVLKDDNKGREIVVAGADDREVGSSTGTGETKSQGKRHGQKRTRAAAKVDEEEESRKSSKRRAVGVNKANAMAKIGERSVDVMGEPSEQADV
jgi:hypothetical protein